MVDFHKGSTFPIFAGVTWFEMFRNSEPTISPLNLGVFPSIPAGHSHMGVKRGAARGGKSLLAEIAASIPKAFRSSAIHDRASRPLS